MQTNQQHQHHQDHQYHQNRVQQKDHQVKLKQQQEEKYKK
jgi:hypothetical protein